MRQLVFHGPWQLSVEPAELPAPAAGEVRLRVHSVGICGSDVHGYIGLNGRRVPDMVMGHEGVGVVEELGGGVVGLAPGTPVAVNPVVGCGACAWCRDGLDNLCPERVLYGCIRRVPGAFADQWVVRAANCVPLHGPAPTEWGALVEPFAVAARAARLGEVGPGHAVAVVGGGPIGLGAALAARRFGAERVVVSEPDAHRRGLAERLGFETVDPTSGALPARAFDVALECVGHAATLEAALEAVPPRGAVVFVGVAEERIELPVQAVVILERRILGSSCYTHEDFEGVARWIDSGATDLAPVIESRVDLDGLVEAFREYAEGRRQAMKTLYQPA